MRPPGLASISSRIWSNNHSRFAGSINRWSEAVRIRATCSSAVNSSVHSCRMTRTSSKRPVCSISARASAFVSGAAAASAACPRQWLHSHPVSARKRDRSPEEGLLADRKRKNRARVQGCGSLLIPHRRIEPRNDLMASARSKGSGAVQSSKRALITCTLDGQRARHRQRAHRAGNRVLDLSPPMRNLAQPSPARSHAAKCPLATAQKISTCPKTSRNRLFLRQNRGAAGSWPL